MTRANAVLAGLALAATALTGGCAGLMDQLQSEEMAIATLLSVPEQTNPAPSGSPIPAVTTFTLTFGRIDRSLVQIDPQGRQTAAAGVFQAINDAEVKLTFNAAQPCNGQTAQELNVPRPAKGDGTYTLVSTSDAQCLSYNANAEYTATISWSGKTYQLKVTPAAKSTIKEFESDKLIENFAAGTPFTVTRKPAAGVAGNTPAFVTLTQVSAQGNVNLAWTNAPQDALGFVQLVLDDGDWRADSFTIPGEKIQAGNAYAVTLAGFAKGSVVSGVAGVNALFLGSTFLAGTADNGGLVAQ